MSTTPAKTLDNVAWLLHRPWKIFKIRKAMDSF